MAEDPYKVSKFENNTLLKKIRAVLSKSYDYQIHISFKTSSEEKKWENTENNRWLINQSNNQRKSYII